MTEPWLQEKYILLLSNRLDKFKRASSNLFRFRCCYCGDSEKNKTKTRGYFYKKANDYKFHCHNCGQHKYFEQVLKDIDPVLFYEMKKENYGNAQPYEHKPEPIKEPIVTDIEKLPTIESLSDKHPAKKYLINRKIPKDKLKKLYYCDNFLEFVNSLIPGKLESQKHAIPRIIIPFFDKNNNLFGFQGRAIDPEESIRYISIILDESKPKAYNVNKVDYNKRYYVFEGPFDSMFFENSIAVCGSDVLSVLNSLQCNKDNAVIVFDNEPRNKEIVKNIGRAIEYGWTVCIWPDIWEFKDINEGILKGNTTSVINFLIDTNTWSGTMAKLKLSQWRKDD